jgi:hypothetical protein
MSGEFAVGNLNLSSLMKVEIPEYGHDLPEIHSSSPIIYPLAIPISIIINWLERGIGVVFVNKDEDIPRLLVFVTEYNLFASEENKRRPDTLQPLRFAYNAEDRLKRMTSKAIEFREQELEEKVPFKKRIFKGSIGSSGVISSSSYQDPFIHRFKKKKQMDKAFTGGEPSAAKAYDIFSSDIDALSPYSSEYDSIPLT